MAKVKPFHAKHSSVYHNNSSCTEGNNIEKENKQKGTGKNGLCKSCLRLNKSKK